MIYNTGGIMELFTLLIMIIGSSVIVNFTIKNGEE